jgi:hypothetical protein
MFSNRVHFHLKSVLFYAFVHSLLSLSSVADLDPHQSEGRIRIRIRLKVKRKIRFRIKVMRIRNTASINFVRLHIIVSFSLLLQEKGG